MATILLVDDNDTFRKAIHRKLKRSGHTIIEAEDGQKAIVALEAFHIDIIISDVQMPNMDGVRFFDWVEANRPDLAKRFLFHSGAESILTQDTKLKDIPRITKPFLGDIDQVIAPYLDVA